MAQNLFRNLNDNEYHMLSKLSGAGHIPGAIDWPSLTVSYETFSGGFTVCLIRFWVTEFQTTYIWRGVARCSHHDKYNKIKGEALAFKKAIMYSWPVEI